MRLKIIYFQQIDSLYTSIENSQSELPIRGPSKAVLDVEKAYWTGSVMTIKSLQFWKIFVPKV